MRKQKKDSLKISTFRLRKIVHFSLIACVLLIQLLIAGYFYNESRNKKNLTFIENQLKELHLLENLTDHSRKELLNAQNNFQKYITTEDKQYLKSYFKSLNMLSENLDSIKLFQDKNPRLKNILTQKEAKLSNSKNLKVLIDSTYDFSTKPKLKAQNPFPALQKYTFDFNIEKYDIQTKTITDTVKKKSLFGRLGDAVAGKVAVQKETTVTTMKQSKNPMLSKIKSDVDSIVNQANDHYFGVIKTIQVNVNNNEKDDKKNSGSFYKIFNNLLLRSNDLMGVYEFATKGSKSELEKELAKQNSASNKIRERLVLGAMVLMFIISILIMYLTRIAFIYEKKLNDANKQIKENLNFKNRILGMLSHELRSPLKIIDLFIKRIHNKTADETVKGYLQSMSFTNNTLLMQANQILEYTKNQHVENKLLPVVFNLKNEIDAILTSIKPYIETRNNRFLIDENIDPEIVVYSDNTKINQLFMNILGNANKFTENGQISVAISTETVDENTISLATKISDTGVGISKSDLEKIFEPYYQGVLSEDVENLGAGLGLSLCKEQVGLYNGKISVSSEINQGTTVLFSLNLNLNK